MGKLKVTTLFSGIGAQEAGLKRLGVDFEMVGMCEIDKYAIKSYEAINGPTHNYGDISKIDRLDYTDLLVYSSPCQDFSLAGKQAGLVGEDGKQTRSGLLLEVGRLLMKMSDEKILPKYLLMENVKNLVGKKFKPAFDIWLQALEAIGYNNYWKVLNAKDYGVPQNRERVFVVSIRKDVDTNGYTFPEPFKLERRLKDVLETNVDEKFYLSQKLVEEFIRKLERRQDTLGKINIQDVNKTCSTITTRILKCSATDPYICQNPHGFNHGGIVKDNLAPTMTANGSYHSNNFVINEPLIAASRGRNPENPLSREVGLPTEQQLEINRTGCSNTLTTVGKDNLVVEPKINVLGNYTPSGHECGGVMGIEGIAPTIKDNHGAMYSIAEPQIKQIGNLYPSKTRDNPNRGRVYDKTGLPPALTCMGGGNREPCALRIGIGHNPVSKKFEFDGFHEDKPSPTLLATDYKTPKCWSDGVRIRKLTPKECWRLMDFTDEEFEKAAYEKETFYLEGDKEKCNANLRVVKEKQKLTNTETYVSCTINDTNDMEILKTIKKLLAETPESEKMQNVNFVITKSAEAELLECATNTTKCITFMGMRCILMEEKDRQVTAIIVQEKGGKESIAKFMKITIKSSLNSLKLYTILILIAQIMRLGIYGSSILQVSIQGVIAIIGNCENSILLKILNLKMENMCTRVSSSQLYKQAGNSIVVSCLAHIFRELFKGTEYEPNNGF